MIPKDVNSVLERTSLSDGVNCTLTRSDPTDWISCYVRTNLKLSFLIEIINTIKGKKACSTVSKNGTIVVQVMRNACVHNCCTGDEKCVCAQLLYVQVMRNACVHMKIAQFMIKAHKNGTIIVYEKA